MPNINPEDSPFFPPPLRQFALFFFSEAFDGDFVEFL